MKKGYTCTVWDPDRPYHGDKDYAVFIKVCHFFEASGRT